MQTNHTTPVDTLPGSNPRVSVVVIGRNEGGRLTRCLESVRRAEGGVGGVELIYVDSDSSDDSRERAARAGATVLRVRPARPCAAIGRNAGWRAASGDFVLFLDGDTVLHPDFLPRALAAVGAAGLAVLARTYRRCAWKSPSRLSRALYAVHSHAQQLPILAGQLAFRLDRRLGRRRGLIEYRAGA